MINAIRNGKIFDTVNRNNFIQISDRKLFYAGLPVSDIQKSNDSLFPCKALYDIVSLGVIIGKIYIKEPQIRLIKDLSNERH